jgi:hypothetical protein
LKNSLIYRQPMEGVGSARGPLAGGGPNVARFLVSPASQRAGQYETSTKPQGAKQEERREYRDKNNQHGATTGAHRWR